MGKAAEMGIFDMRLNKEKSMSDLIIGYSGDTDPSTGDTDPQKGLVF